MKVRYVWRTPSDMHEDFAIESRHEQGERDIAR